MNWDPPPARRVDTATKVFEVDISDASTASKLAELQRASYRVEADLTGIESIPHLTEPPEALAGSGLTVLAIQDAEGDPVAMVGYRREHGVVDIDRLVVAPTHFRRGLARRLLLALHAREQSAIRFEVSTGAGNEPASRLYRSVGYRSMGTVRLGQGVVVERFERGRLSANS